MYILHHAPKWSSLLFIVYFPCYPLLLFIKIYLRFPSTWPWNIQRFTNKGSSVTSANFDLFLYFYCYTFVITIHSKIFGNMLSFCYTISCALPVTWYVSWIMNNGTYNITERDHENIFIIIMIISLQLYWWPDMKFTYWLYEFIYGVLSLDMKFTYWLYEFVYSVLSLNMKFRYWL